MSEFDESWPVWSLKTEADSAVERIIDPVGGIAPIDTGFDVSGLMTSMDERIDKLLEGLGNSERSVYMTYSDKWSDEALRKLLADQLDSLSELFGISREVLAPVEEVLEPNVPFGFTTGSQLLIGADRRIQLTPTHTDYKLLTMWFGSTKPGLKVLPANGNDKEDWITVDGVPPGHALLWRGQWAYDTDKKPLEPIRHYARYRSVARRIVLLS